MLFFLFFKNFDFLSQKLVKRHKLPKMTCNAIHIMFWEVNIMRLWFLLHWCKMMIYPGIFFIFQKFWFFGPKSVERAKRGLNNLYWCVHHFLVTISLWVWFSVHSYRMMKFVGLYLTFIKLLICRVIKWGKRTKMTLFGMWYSLHYIWGTFVFWNTALLTNGIIPRLFLSG